MFWKYVNILKSILFRNFIRLKGIDIAVSIFLYCYHGYILIVKEARCHTFVVKKIYYRGTYNGTLDIEKRQILAAL